MREGIRTRDPRERAPRERAPGAPASRPPRRPPPAPRTARGAPSRYRSGADASADASPSREPPTRLCREGRRERRRRRGRGRRGPAAASAAGAAAAAAPVAAFAAGALAAERALGALAGRRAGRDEPARTRATRVAIESERATRGLGRRARAGDRLRARRARRRAEREAKRGDRRPTHPGGPTRRAPRARDATCGTAERWEDRGRTGRDDERRGAVITGAEPSLVSKTETTAFADRAFR